MVIVETAVFTKLIKEMLSDDEYKNLQEVLISRPASGDLIKESGGLRKIRWSVQGTGKSGGIRVIYYWVVDDHHIRMLYVYPKGKQDNLTKAQVAQLKAIVERWQQ
ncbi:type II toxin-antitoxin system RelE/ParE family toxin [Amphritea sp.]|uniref:type II toxin-antitoxin system RelE/ParE family toxin n=1 Tax=Amphritea sp. TaxID=1872502 RepID=UPI0025B80DDE|nr:type II toxin-antitoxin system RelE/ParE family toxin [Amphritea sp.]